MSIWEVIYIDTSMNFDLNYVVKQVVNKLIPTDPSLINDIPKILKRIHYAVAKDNYEMCY